MHPKLKALVAMARFTDDDPNVVRRNLGEMKERAKTRARVGGTWHVNKRSDGTYFISSERDRSTVATYRHSVTGARGQYAK